MISDRSVFLATVKLKLLFQLNIIHYINLTSLYSEKKVFFLFKETRKYHILGCKGETKPIMDLLTNLLIASVASSCHLKTSQRLYCHLYRLG